VHDDVEVQSKVASLAVASPVLIAFASGQPSSPEPLRAVSQATMRHDVPMADGI
jgi:hypothetical protein